jgi:hypothetical protein
MWKRVALLGTLAALTTIAGPSHSFAQAWDGGWGGGWGGGGVTVTVTGFPGPIPRRPVPCCERRFIPRPVVCCERPFIPRPVVCCDRPIPPRPVLCCDRGYFPRPFRPPYFYGDYFAPYAYNWNRYDGYDGYDNYNNYNNYNYNW